MELSGRLKDDEKFSLAVLQENEVRPGCLVYLLCAETVYQPSQMYNITAGDPSRGPISLETQAAPPPGSRVQVRLTRQTACISSDKF